MGKRALRPQASITLSRERADGARARQGQAFFVPM